MTPDDLIARLDALLTGFQAYVRSTKNPFDPDSVHGVFASLSHFVRDHSVTTDAWIALGAMLNRIVGGVDRRLRNAACTCFLEILAAPDHPLRKHLLGEALAYWMRWEPGGSMEMHVSGGAYPLAAVCVSAQAFMDDRDGMIVAAEPGVRDLLLTEGKKYVILGGRLGMYIVVNDMGSTSLHPKPCFRKEEGGAEAESK